MTTDQIVDRLTELTQQYANTYRGNVDYQKYMHLQKLTWKTIIDFDQERVRESLICHVGHLPIVASYIHPFLEHTDDVDLWRALMMLAIHDIGETVVGDVITTARDRTKEEDNAEQKAIHDLLTDTQYMLYQEYEHPTTNTGRFAKSIDKIWWQIMAYANDAEIERERINHFGFSIESVEQRYQGLMTRDGFLVDFFWTLMKKTKQKLAVV